MQCTGPKQQLSLQLQPVDYHSRPLCRKHTSWPCRASAAQPALQSQQKDKVELGRSGCHVSALGIGTLQWGDPGTGFGKAYREGDLEAAFKAAREGGVTFFDTAEVYGYQNIKFGQSSEQILGRLLSQDTASTGTEGQQVITGTKFFTIPWTNALVGGGLRLGRQSMKAALQASLKRMGRSKIDLYSVHFPFPSFPQSTLADGLQEALDLGLCSHVGVCNYDRSQLDKLQGLLEKKGTALVTNQVAYSILNRKIDKSGLLQHCRDLGITVVAHSPLQQGLLTSKYVEGGGPKEAESARVLLKLLQFVGSINRKSVTQVALNYLMCKGAIPIPGCKNVMHVQEHTGAMGWRLDDNEVAIIDEKLDSMGK